MKPRLASLEKIAAGLTVGAALTISQPAAAQLFAPSCAVSNSTLAFGSYNPISASPTVSTATVSVNCAAIFAQTVPFTVLLSAGNSGNAANRRMSSGGSNLPYNIYTTASFARIWDDSTGVTGSVTLMGFFPARGTANLTAYGRILAGQLAPVGTYADTLIIILNF